MPNVSDRQVTSGTGVAIASLEEGFLRQPDRLARVFSAPSTKVVELYLKHIMEAFSEFGSLL